MGAERRLSLTLTGAGTLPEATDGAAGLSFWFIGRFPFSQTPGRAIAAIGAIGGRSWGANFNGGKIWLII
jgi:hypothetical protein